MKDPMSGCLFPYHPIPASPQGLFSAPPPPSLPAERAAIADVRWPNGSRIRVGFLNRTDGWGQLLRQAVKRIAPTWGLHANLTFEFVEGWAEDVTINFSPDLAPYGTYSSYLGRDCRQASRSRLPSTHLVFDPSNAVNAQEGELERVILHEFGHVLGLIHEHMRPDRPILWNQPAVYRYYRALTGGAWDWPTIYGQVIAPFERLILAETAFDPLSIMMYPFPVGLAEYTDGKPFETAWNQSLTAADKALVAAMYPK